MELCGCEICAPFFYPLLRSGHRGDANYALRCCLGGRGARFAQAVTSRAEATLRRLGLLPSQPSLSHYETMQSLRDWDVSELAEAERRVPEINALIERQRQLIEELERDGHDLTSAKIILDCLRVSLSLYIHDRHRARCHVEPERPEMVLAAQTLATCLDVVTLLHQERRSVASARLVTA